MGKSKGFRNLRRIVFGVRFKARVRRAFGSAFVERDLPFTASPALGEHSVCREFRRSGAVPAGDKLSAQSACKCHDGKRLRELVAIEIAIRPLAFEIFCNDPIDVVKRKSLAQLDYRPRFHAGYSNVAKHPLNVVAMLRHRAVSEPGPEGVIVRRALHLERQELTF